MTDIQPEIAQASIKPSSSLDTFARVMLTLSLLAVAGVAITYLLLALPANDDFHRAALTPHVTDPNTHVVHAVKMNLWGYCKYIYMRWQGRWVSFSSEAAVLPAANMTRTYPVLIAAVDFISLIGLFVVCRFFTRSASRWFSLACSLCLAGVLWAQMPSPAETVYWFVGGVENLLVLSLGGMLLVGLVCFRASIPWMIFASVLAIMTTGIHEAWGAMLCVALTAGTFAAYWMGGPNRKIWLVALIAAAAGLAIVVFAPGNKVRMDSDVNHRVRTWSVVLKLTGTQLWNSGREWLFDPKLLAAGLFVAFSPRLEASRPVWNTSNRVPWRLLIPLTCIAMLCVGFFLPSYAFVGEMPRRTLTANFIVFAMGFLMTVFVWTRKLDLRDPVEASPHGLRSGGAASIAMLIMAASLVLDGNTLEGARDLATRKVFKWRSTVEKRYALLRSQRGKDLVLPRLAPASRLFYSGEIDVDPLNWKNYSMSDYFGVKSIRVLPNIEKNPTTAPASEGEQPSQNM